MDKVFINQEAHLYVLHANGTLDLSALQLPPASIVNIHSKLQTDVGLLVLT